MWKGNYQRNGYAQACLTLCRELCKNGWNDRFAVWVVNSGRPKEAQVQSYCPGGANVPSWEGTLAPLGEYDWTVHLSRQCGLTSNCFDHLFLTLLLFDYLDDNKGVHPTESLLQLSPKYCYCFHWNEWQFMGTVLIETNQEYTDETRL